MRSKFQIGREKNYKNFLSFFSVLKLYYFSKISLLNGGLMTRTLVERSSLNIVEMMQLIF